ncbi:MAG: cupin domain-containing protein [Clostridiales bacterium]|nr:cupin domain-containing protein [Clostridiales bacterium]
MWNIPYVIDLDDHEGSGIKYFTRYHANGEPEEIMSAVVDGEGDHGLYNVTDTVMCKMPTGVTPEEASKMAHMHHNGFETFFVDSGLMYLYVDGKRCLIREGDIVQLQAEQMHAMASLEDVKWRGFFSDLDSFTDALMVNAVADLFPGAKEDPEFIKAKGERDFVRREQPVFRDVPAEEVNAVKHPSRPLYEYAFDGLTAKVIVPRWENGGMRELVLAEMAKGTKIEWGYHTYREQYYVRKGRVRLEIGSESYIAGKSCIINVPKLAPFSLTALEDADVYDTGGQTHWFSFLLDYASLSAYSTERFNDPGEIAALKDKFNIPVKSITAGNE